MTDPTAHARVLLALQAEVDNLRELLDFKAHEAGLYALRMEQAQQSRDKARSEERAAVVAWLREQADAPETYIDEGIALRDASAAIERGEHRREEES